VRQAGWRGRHDSASAWRPETRSAGNIGNVPSELLLDPETQRFVAAERGYATIATINEDGSVHQTVIWYLLRDDGIVINSRAGRRWPTNLLRDPRLSFTVMVGSDYVTLSGQAEPVDEGEGAQADIAEMARRYTDPPSAARYIAQFRTQRRVSFLFRPRAAHRGSE